MLTNPCTEPGHDYTGVACQKCFAKLVADRDRYKAALEEIAKTSPSDDGERIRYGAAFDKVTSVAEAALAQNS